MLRPHHLCRDRAERARDSETPLYPTGAVSTFGPVESSSASSATFGRTILALSTAEAQSSRWQPIHLAQDTRTQKHAPLVFNLLAHQRDQPCRAISRLPLWRRDDLRLAPVHRWGDHTMGNHRRPVLTGGYPMPARWRLKVCNAPQTHVD